jgi:hypothetical protein
MAFYKKWFSESVTRHLSGSSSVYARLSRLESAGTVLGLNFVLKLSCLTNQALNVCHSVSGVSSSTSKFRRNVGTSL